MILKRTKVWLNTLQLERASMISFQNEIDELLDGPSMYFSASRHYERLEKQDTEEEKKVSLLEAPELLHLGSIINQNSQQVMSEAIVQLCI